MVKRADDEFVFDDCVTRLTPSDYVQVRLTPLMHGLELEVPRTGWCLQGSQFLVLAATIGSSAMAAIGSYRHLIPVTVVIAGAIGYIRDFERLETLLQAQHTALTRLHDLTEWWAQLPAIQD